MENERDGRVHTPGPWEIDNTGSGIYGAQGTKKASRVCGVTDGYRQRANAALISAAPDLLEALESALEYGVSLVVDRKVRSAIAKARRRI